MRGTLYIVHHTSPSASIRVHPWLKKQAGAKLGPCFYYAVGFVSGFPPRGGSNPETPNTDTGQAKKEGNKLINVKPYLNTEAEMNGWLWKSSGGFNMRYFAAAVVFFLIASAAFAGDIVTVPTANQLKAGQFDVADYYLGLDMPTVAPQNVQAQTLYVGVTDRLEVDAHRYDIDKVGSSTIINATVLLLSEDLVNPDLVIGGRNIFGEQVTPDPRSDKPSWFISTAKTLNLPVEGPPTLPILRAHLSLGTEDYTLLGEQRHRGFFGGLQALLTPEIGAIALHDGQDLITGLTFTPQKLGLTIKGGMFGDHWWVGVSYTR